MCKKINILLGLFLCSVSCIAQIPAIDSVVKSEMEKRHVVGLSLAILADDRVIVHKGYGFADIANSKPASSETIYKIGSISKQFIATNIMALAEQGKLSLSDHIYKYFPDAPDEWRDITIRNLLNHTSGIERESPAFKWMKRQPDSVLIEATYKDKLHFATGTKWEYSNMGYFILADIIRKVSGQSFEDYMNNFFIRCGMNNTVTTDKSTGPEKAKGYVYNEKSGKSIEEPDLIALRPSGAFSSSIDDMMKWDSILRSGTILTKEDWAKMWGDTVHTGEVAKGQMDYYGYGWRVRLLRNKHRLVFHGGSEPGFISEYWRYIDDGIAIIVLTNSSDIDAVESISKKIAIQLNRSASIKK